MEFSETENEITPQDAVSDAMLAVLNKRIKPVFEKERIRNDSIPDVEELLVNETSAECQINSLAALQFLTKKYPKLFSRLMLYKSWEDNEHTFKPHTNSDGSSYHAYFLAQGIDGKWYAGSPANYSHDGYNPATSVISAPILSDVVSQIGETDGGIWPTGDEIEQSLLKETYQSPFEIRRYYNRKLIPRLTVFTVERDEFGLLNTGMKEWNMETRFFKKDLFDTSNPKK